MCELATSAKAREEERARRKRDTEARKRKADELARRLGAARRTGHKERRRVHTASDGYTDWGRCVGNAYTLDPPEGGPDALFILNRNAFPDRPRMLTDRVCMPTERARMPTASDGYTDWGRCVGDAFTLDPPGGGPEARIVFNPTAFPGRPRHRTIYGDT